MPCPPMMDVILVTVLTTATSRNSNWSGKKSQRPLGLEKKKHQEKNWFQNFWYARHDANIYAAYINGLTSEWTAKQWNPKNTQFDLFNKIQQLKTETEKELRGENEKKSSVHHLPLIDECYFSSNSNSRRAGERGGWRNLGRGNGNFVASQYYAIQFDSTITDGNARVYFISTHTHTHGIESNCFTAPPLFIFIAQQWTIYQGGK